jgi:hypothetical protein
LASAFIDVSKAFDTVSYYTVLRATEAFGAPSLLINYLRSKQNNSFVTLDGRREVRCKRGVRQGDPLSPILFVMAMEEVLSASKPEIRFEKKDLKVHALAYADDLVVFAGNEMELREKLVELERALAEAGMQINVKKSRGLTIKDNKKLKHSVLLDTEYKLLNDNIPPVGTADTLKYLGLSFNWKGRVPVIGLYIN